MDRRTFIKNAGVVSAWVGVSVVFWGCSDDDDPSAPNPNPGDVVGRVGSNHGHSVAISGAQITAANAVTLTLSSGNGHNHTVALDGAQVGTIGAGNSVTATSSSNSGHTHLVTFS
jgi:hypothetical protein